MMSVRFGPFEVDSERRLLLKEGGEVHLKPKAFDLLALLVAEAPRVVRKDELHRRLWPGTFVSDATLVGLNTGNVFRDLGFSKEESEHLLVRADLLIQVQKAITSRRLKQAEAAKVLRVTQPRVSDLLRGRIDLFSTDALIDMLARLGVGVRLVVKTTRSKKVA
jgi:predicted XRE-type DNA-binding protein